ncbi:MAG: hypothetical protein K6E62_11385, partial [Lachnospiraceae bacterium]|nr:hypothetical protein [Lachnospiraceae bacterium]
VLYVYGSLSKGTADRYVKNYGLEIISFPDRRNRIWNGSLSYRYFLSEGKVVKEVYYDVTLKGGAA